MALVLYFFYCRYLSRRIARVYLYTLAIHKIAMQCCTRTNGKQLLTAVHSAQYSFVRLEYMITSPTQTCSTYLRQVTSRTVLPTWYFFLCRRVFPETVCGKTRLQRLKRCVGDMSLPDKSLSILVVTTVSGNGQITIVLILRILL